MAGETVAPMPELRHNVMLIAGNDGKLPPEDGRHHSPNEVVWKLSKKKLAQFSI